MSLARCIVCFAVATALTHPCIAEAKKPQRVAPKRIRGKQRRAQRRASKDLSQAGTRRGVIEFSLGSLMGVLSGVLIGRGAWELVRANRVDPCLEFDVVCQDEASFQTRDSRIAAGLSFGMAVPAALATGFLFARGARVHRDYKKWKLREGTVALSPTFDRSGGGLSLRVNF